MYVIVWKYEVSADRDKDFRVAYGPDGDWARFFGNHDGYLGTELITNELSGQYMTIDRWESAETFAAYLETEREEYQRLDQQFESLTVSEQLVGRGSALESRSAGS
jgi:heme-degrading monooxygenase HmoA